MKIWEDFSGGGMAKTPYSLPMQEGWVQSLVWELRSHMLHGMVKREINKK